MNDNAYPIIRPGDLLIASPLLKDPNFNRSVILILDRDKDRGYIGLILNRPLELTMEEICQITDSDRTIPVFNGGPVDLQRLFWIHKLGDTIAGAKEIMPGIYIGGNYDDLQQYIQEDNPVDGVVRFYLGYSGWTKGQLEKEIEAGAWKVNSLADPGSIIEGGDISFWREQVKALGPSFRHWLMLPTDPSLN